MFSTMVPLFRGRGSREALTPLARRRLGQRRPRRSADTRYSRVSKLVAWTTSARFLPRVLYLSPFFFFAAYFSVSSPRLSAEYLPGRRGTFDRACFPPSDRCRTPRESISRTGRRTRSQCRLTFRTRIASIERSWKSSSGANSV